MKAILIITLFSILSCTSKNTKVDSKNMLLGQWTLLEMKCENNDYTDAGKELRAFYLEGKGLREMQINDSKITTIIVNTKKADKDCTININSSYKTKSNQITYIESNIIKESKTDKKCQGKLSYKNSNTSETTYAFNNDQLILKTAGPVKRLSKDLSSEVCKSSALLSIYKKID